MHVSHQHDMTQHVEESVIVVEGLGCFGKASVTLSCLPQGFPALCGMLTYWRRVEAEGAW